MISKNKIKTTYIVRLRTTLIKHCVKLMGAYYETFEAAIKGIDFIGRNIHIFLSLFAIMNLVKMIHIN